MHKIQSQEHEGRQQKLHIQHDVFVTGGQAEGGGGILLRLLPESVLHIGPQVDSHRVDSADNELQGDAKHPVTGHGNAPVHLVVVNDEKLEERKEKQRQDVYQQENHLIDLIRKQ